MNSLRALTEFMKADIRERTRRYSFLVTIAATLYLGYLVNDGTIGVHLGNYLPVPNSAWTGIMMALCTITFVGLVGFYVVKNAIERDRETGVGQILAGTPVNKVLYILGKLLSNFAVLAIVTGILALAAVLMQAFKGSGLAILPLLAPFFFLSLPAMFFVAAMAIFFESVRILRGGFGNILFFFVYTALFVIPMETGVMATDIFGIKLAIDRIQADVRAAAPDYNGSLNIGITTKEDQNPKPVTWGGIPWTSERIGYRGLIIVYALALSMLAALIFDRFAAPAAAKKGGRLKRYFGRRWKPLQGFVFKRRVFPPGIVFGRSSYGRILFAELRLMVQGLAPWWYIVALGLWIASIVMDPASSRATLLPFLWIWPALLWSGLGTREKLYRTGSVLFSSPRPLARQLPATWGAGFVVAIMLASGVLLRLALIGDVSAFLSIIAGAVFIPSLALALGVWSGTSKTFEAFYVAFWYLGPVHHIPSIDFMGTTDAAVSAGAPATFAVCGVILIVIAFAGRRRQLAGA